MMHIGMVAGEASGDRLGAELIAALCRQYPGLRCTGIGGPRMQAAGFQTLAPMERLSVMGLLEPLGRLPQLLALRRRLVRHFLSVRPALYLGIDAPDFNLGLAARLRARGIPAAHCVSPSVWAWRRGRVRSIARAVDRMLTLFPFEAEFYREHKIPVSCIGHPLVGQLYPPASRSTLRRELGLPVSCALIALLPGSRASEVRHHARLFLRAAAWCQAHQPDLCFVVPAANPSLYSRLQGLMGELPAGGKAGNTAVRVVEGQADRVLGAADAALVVSGTATLEAMLLGCPMAVAFRTDFLSHAIVSRMLHTPWVALPNLLAGRQLVPEFLQRAATPAALGSALLSLLEKGRASAMRTEFEELRKALPGDTAARAVAALAPLLPPPPVQADHAAS